MGLANTNMVGIGITCPQTWSPDNSLLCVCVCVCVCVREREREREERETDRDRDRDTETETERVLTVRVLEGIGFITVNRGPLSSDNANMPLPAGVLQLQVSLRQILPCGRAQRRVLRLFILEPAHQPPASVHRRNAGLRHRHPRPVLALCCSATGRSERLHQLHCPDELSLVLTIRTAQQSSIASSQSRDTFSLCRYCGTGMAYMR